MSWWYRELRKYFKGDATVDDSPAAGDFIGFDGSEWTNQKLGGHSTSQTDTGKVWTSGDIIYRKVVDCGSMPNTTLKNVAHGISSLVGITKIEGVVNNGSPGTSLPLPYVGTTAAIQIQVDTTYIKITTDANFSSYSGFVILEYIL